MQVSSVAGVAFNNLLCSKLPLTQENTTSTKKAAESRNSLTVPSPLLIEYALTIAQIDDYMHVCHANFTLFAIMCVQQMKMFCLLANVQINSWLTHCRYSPIDFIKHNSTLPNQVQNETLPSTTLFTR